MKNLVGFTIHWNLSEKSRKILHSAQNRALLYFKHLETKNLTVGETHIDIWGHRGMESRVHTLPDGSLAILVGSPHTEVDWEDARNKLLADHFEIPWDGRVVLLRISKDGKKWTMWNDWLGSIPVFHAEIGQGRVLSTLEPVIVEAAGYTPDDFFLPGLVSLLINGHYLSDWTLYKRMKTVLPDSVAEWDEKGFRIKQLWTVQPSRSRLEADWNDLVDEMHAVSHKAVADILKTRPKWILPLSSGLDSRLIAGVAADIGANVDTYAWGGRNTTDVVYSHHIAKTLGLPWKHVDLPNNFLSKYTPLWADWFGSSMHFHGMYQMCFLDAIASEPTTPVICGFMGDVLAGAAIKERYNVHASGRSFHVNSYWACHWTASELQSCAKFPLKDALEANADEFKRQLDARDGAFYQRVQFLSLWNRQRFFTNFQSTLSDYWCGVANPFMNREYARFCLSIPRTALDDRKLLCDVYRRYYGSLAVIPGTYAQDPYILTGKYLVMRRIANLLPAAFYRGPLKGFGNAELRMDIHSIQATGKEALWPIFDVWDHLREWIDVDRLNTEYQAVMNSAEDIRPLRKLQSIQTLAYRLLNHKDTTDHP